MSELIMLGCMNSNTCTFESTNRVYDPIGISPTITTCQGGGQEPKTIEIHKIIYDSYNSAVRKDQTTMTALTTNCGHSGLRGGVKIIELSNIEASSSCAMRGRYEQSDKTSQCLEVRQDEVCNNLTTVQKDSLVLETCSTITTIPENFRKFVYEIDGEFYLIRIRKLTPKECWRLMGFSDEDFQSASCANSNSQLYKQAGNSIVKQVLMSVFLQMM